MTSIPSRIAICDFLDRRKMRGGGVLSYLQTLVQGVQSVDEEAEIVGLYTNGNLGAFAARLPQNQRFIQESIFGLMGSSKFDAVLFPDYFTPPIVRSKKKFVVIHDLQFRWMPEMFSAKKRWWLRRSHRHSLRYCDAVVAISQSCKDDLVAEYGQQWEAKVKVIPNAVPWPLLLEESDSDEAFPVESPFILTVGVDRPQKNLVRLVEAFSHVANEWPELKLVVVGASRKRTGAYRNHATVGETVQSLDLSGRVVQTGLVSTSMLGQLYRRTEMFVMPSLFEGFGMPAVEAISMGAPSLLADIPALREVAGDSAQYIGDATSPQVIADCVREALRNPSKPNESQVNEIRERHRPSNVALAYLDLLRS